MYSLLGKRCLIGSPSTVLQIGSSPEKNRTEGGLVINLHLKYSRGAECIKLRSPLFTRARSLASSIVRAPVTARIAWGVNRSLFRTICDVTWRDEVWG